jgi:CDP-diacylglycerol--glycerol-3-phosphate 3-phosphatidyltransferase
MNKRYLALGEIRVLSDHVRKWTEGIRAWAARLLGRLKVSPNVLTVVGYLLHLPAMIALANGHMQLGGIIVAVASLFDALDGSVAREMRQSSTFGAFLDSTLDRYSEGTIFLGLLIWCARNHATTEVVLIYVAVFGSLMVSYTRARAEGVGIACKAGWFTRFERVLLIVIGLVTKQVPLLLWALAVLSNVTAVQRIAHVWHETRGKGEPSR